MKIKIKVEFFKERKEEKGWKGPGMDGTLTQGRPSWLAAAII